MKYYDQHLHTDFSYDSEESFERYLEAFSGFIVTTEHFDLANPVTGEDNIPDYLAYTQKVDQLNQKFDNRILKGIEIGYFAGEKQRTLDYLDDKDYDLKLLSVHHNGVFDYLDDFVASMDYNEIIPQYLAKLTEAIDSIPANVLAHFDYGFRLFDLSVHDLKRYETQLIDVFKASIEHNLAFEINAKSAYLYHNLTLYDYAIDLYRSLGGKRFTIGSDGHKLEHFRLHFDELINLAKEKGIKQLATYQKGQVKMVDI
ncbi:MAG: PHP domain-containing protein [Streptococcaceae bacterium]|jgi:histidinol-phosphatase (PHP family)|nr:PHP domain-containing protein [Streptococcaceae bacterium]